MTKLLRSKNYVPRRNKQDPKRDRGHLMFSIRMTVEEWLLLEHRAQAAGVTKADFIRSKLR